MHPGNQPPCLQNLTQTEEMLIARACPLMCIYTKHGGQRGYRGNVLNMPQDVQNFLKRLPRSPSTLPIVVVRKPGANKTHIDLTVRRDVVLWALQWLQQNNPFYKEITIDQDILQSFPENGVPQDLQTMDGTIENQEDMQPDIASDPDSPPTTTQSFLPTQTRTPTEDSAIQHLVNGADPLDWPDVTGQPINEFRTVGLVTMAFPTLFPHGIGDPTNPGRSYEVSLTDGFRHLIKFGECIDGNEYKWRFASHPRFPY